MSINDQGKLFLKVAARALAVGMEEIPIVGAVVKIGNECWKTLQEVQENTAQDERIAQLEQAAAIAPDEARQIAAAAMQEMRNQGQAVDSQRAAVVQDLMAMMPAQIQGRTQATLNHARRLGTQAVTALPVTSQFPMTNRQAFYNGLFPQRRPQFQAGDILPGNVEWQLDRLIGTGGFGEVWLAQKRHFVDEPPRAIKFCQDALSAKVLKREATNLLTLIAQLKTIKQTNSLASAHIVPLVGLQFDVMPYWLAFEYVAGGTLESRMRLGPMDWPTAWQLFQPIVEGMAVVHALGIVHRDLKPANILLDAQQQPRIADFGIGKILSEFKAAATRSRKDSTMAGYGTYGYMSPEQVDGEIVDGEMGHTSDDVYALGVILWQMVAGRLQPLRYPAEIQSLPVPEAVQAALTACVFMPRAGRPAHAGALLQQITIGLRAEKLAKSPRPTPQQLPAEPQEQVFRRKAEPTYHAPVLQKSQRDTTGKMKLGFAVGLVFLLLFAGGLWFARQQQLPQQVVSVPSSEPASTPATTKNQSFEPEMVSIPAGSFRMGSPNNQVEIQRPSRVSDWHYVAGLNPNGDNFLSLRSGPDSSYSELIRMGPNTLLRVVGRKGRWLKVKLSEVNISGWAYDNWIKCCKSRY